MADITLTEETGFGLASILAHRGGVPVVADMTLLGVGPNQWLALKPGANPDWTDDLANRLAGQADVVDQSGAYVLLALTGADTRRVLQKGLSIDLSRGAFGPDAVAVSMIAHIGVILHCVAPQTFRLAVFRSFAPSLRHWLAAAITAL